MKRCPSFPGYSVTSDGRIISHRPRGTRIPGRPGGTMSVIDFGHNYTLRPFVNKKGYSMVSICFDGKKKRPMGVHQLVADAFLGPCPPGQQVRHWDDNPANNAPSNLRYGTFLDNAQDRQRNGGYAVGEAHANAKLTNEQAAQIRTERAAGTKVKALATRYAVSVATVESVIYGKTFRVVSESASAPGTNHPRSATASPPNSISSKESGNG